MTAADLIAALQAMPPDAPVTLMLSNEHTNHCYVDFNVDLVARGLAPFQAPTRRPRE
jgi:hypothetical protein